MGANDRSFYCHWVCYVYLMPLFMDIEQVIYLGDLGISPQPFSTSLLAIHPEDSWIGR